jgi:catechol 2,3-dioxygenase-like lactoylglutathione lyase family enzyme
MKILFVASCSPVVSDPAASAAFYVDSIGLPLDQRQGDYVYSEKIEGAKHLGLWPLREAAQACFGHDDWPSSVAVPQASIEFEVDDVAAAAQEMEGKGYRSLHATRTEPWGQTIARFLIPDGLIIGLCNTPWLHAQ